MTAPHPVLFGKLDPCIAERNKWVEALSFVEGYDSGQGYGYSYSYGESSASGLGGGYGYGIVYGDPSIYWQGAGRGVQGDAWDL